MSPTDAVATSIARHLGVPARVVTVLEGESLLNDATALVLLRAAIAATAGSVSIGGIALQFGFSVVVAVAIGLIVGAVNLRLRRALRNPAASTAISFVVPFTASIPTEALGGSDLVARGHGRAGHRQRSRPLPAPPINHAGAAVLDDPTLLRRPDGAQYDPSIVEEVREWALKSSDATQQEVLQETKEQQFEPRLAMIDEQCHMLLQARKNGTYTSSTLQDALAALDAEQITIELKGGQSARTINRPPTFET